MVCVRRHWSDPREAAVLLAKLKDLHWDTRSSGLLGGFGVIAPRPFIHACVRCDDFASGALVHSCRHGPPPHWIKVCIVKKSNRKLFPKLKQLADEGQRKRHAAASATESS